MESSIFNSEVRAGTTGGTLLVVLLQIRIYALLETAVLAATGALVSFIVSMVLKYIAAALKKKKRQ